MKTGIKDNIQKYFEREINVIKHLDYDAMAETVMAIRDAYQREAVIYVFGNGGSAATASHFVCDFNKGISGKLDKKFRMLCLNDNVPVLTAISNDISYEEVFSFQLVNRLKETDLVLAVSGSGNSGNIIRAVEYAKEVGAKVIGMTGYSGGRLKELADYYMHVEADDMQITEDIHIAFGHMMYAVLSACLAEN